MYSPSLRRFESCRWICAKIPNCLFGFNGRADLISGRTSLDSSSSVQKVKDKQVRSIEYFVSFPNVRWLSSVSGKKSPRYTRFHSVTANSNDIFGPTWVGLFTAGVLTRFRVLKLLSYKLTRDRENLVGTSRFTTSEFRVV